MNRKWCAYCKDEILEEEELEVIGCEIYHKDCAEQMVTLYDPFDVTEE